MSARRYEISPCGMIDSIAVFGSEPRMQKAYMRFVNESLGMVNAMYLTILGGSEQCQSAPYPMQSIARIGELLSGGHIKRAVCIILRDDADLPIFQHIGLAKTMITFRLKMNVEFYLAEVKEDGEIEFFRLD